MNNFLNPINIINSGAFSIKDQAWLDRQRIAGKALQEALATSSLYIKEGVTTQDLSDIIETIILQHGCSLTFKGFNGFPGAACVSVNEELVHGIPSKDKVLKLGDIVKVDAGATFEGAITDAAYTAIVGKAINPKHNIVVNGCKSILNTVISFLNENIGKKDLFTGDIGYVIKKEANKLGLNTIIDLSGHGLEYDKPHWFPLVYNDGDKGAGVMLLPGMTFAIEPMVLFGSNKIKVQSDGFTISTEDVGAHWEKTIFIHEDKIEVIAG